jgi:tetratricopeptide (TPR) repeat protein
MKEKGQYLLAFGVVGSMLLVAGFPVFVIFFFGIFAYFIFRIFASGSKNETRDIFEFYLAANEILRDDGRSWFGFEVKEAIARGEAILSRMTAAPPLVHFALGALYNKAGDHQSAINSLTQVIETENGNEAAYVYPTPELKNYVKVLRKIEREPGEAPLTSASIRALERARRLRGKAILEQSRAAYVEMSNRAAAAPQISPKDTTSVPHQPEIIDVIASDSPAPDGQNNGTQPQALDDRAGRFHGRDESPKKEKKDPFADRKPISEVLHDIYDKNIQ